MAVSLAALHGLQRSWRWHHALRSAAVQLGRVKGQQSQQNLRKDDTAGGTELSLLLSCQACNTPCPFLKRENSIGICPSISPL